MFRIENEVGGNGSDHAVVVNLLIKIINLIKKYMQIFRANCTKKWGNVKESEEGFGV